MRFFSGTALFFVLFLGAQPPLNADSTQRARQVPAPKPLIVKSLDKSVSVTKYWARPGKKGHNSAAYMVLRLHGQEEGQALVSASSTLCREVQIHTTLEEVIDDAVVKKMRQVDEVALSPHQKTVFSPGGYHLMLIGLTRDLDANNTDTVDLTLTFKGGQTVDLAVPVKKKPCSCCDEKAPTPPRSQGGTKAVI